MRPSAAHPYRTLPSKYIPRKFVPFPTDALEGTIIDRFEIIVKKQPEHPAVLEHGRVLSYRELDILSNQLAHVILSKQSVLGMPVVFFSDHTATSIINLLGILKAGGAYVAIDPSYPVEQMEAILADTQSQLLLIRTENIAIAEQLVSKSRKIVNIDELGQNIPRTLPTVPLRPDLPAVIFYTSGSTGTPKGVVRDHCAVLHWAMTAVATNFTYFEDRVASPLPGGFSGSATAIFGTLLSGASLYPCDFSNQTVPTIIEWLVKEKITYLQIQLGLFHQLAETLPSDSKIIFPDLRWTATGGEVLHTQVINNWMEHVNRKSVLSYGLSSTEAGLITRQYYSFQTAVEENDTSVGYPVPGSDVSIVDQSGHEVAVNEIGKIRIRSQSIMSGYWNHGEVAELPILTDPWNKSVRTFTSDDLGRCRPDGSLEFLGRADNMVKIRGFSVQLDAIDHLLQKMDGIQDAVCIAHQPTKGGKRIVAYLVPAGSRKPSVTDLREALSAQLPDYMVPSVFVWLEALPHTVNGKIDRKDLPAPSGARPNLRSEFVAPRNEEEELIAKIWFDLLQMESVGVEDNFFELGGDSLSALSMTLEVEKQTAQTVDQAFFQHPTIAHLVETFRREKLQQGTTKITPIQTRSTPQPVVGHSKKSASNLERRKTIRKLASKRFWQDGFILIPIFYKRTILSKSYIEGNRWLSEWCRRPIVIHGIYQAKYELFCQMIASLDGCTVNPVAAFPAYLMGNILQGTIDNVLNVLPEDFLIGILDKLRKSAFPFCSSLVDLIDNSPLNELDKYFSVMGLEYLERAYRESRGVIILTYHSTRNPLAIAALPRRLGCDPIPTISQRIAAAQSPDWQNFRPGDIPLVSRSGLNAGEALRGQHLLTQGKIIQIVSDGDLGAGFGTHRVIVAGRQYFLPTGFAELALNTGAIIVPEYTTSLADSHVYTTFLPPLVIEPGNRDIQIERLMTQYADFLSSSWKAAPESINWKKIQKHFKYAIATEEKPIMVY